MDGNNFLASYTLINSQGYKSTRKFFVNLLRGCQHKVWHLHGLERENPTRNVGAYTVSISHIPRQRCYKRGRRHKRVFDLVDSGCSLIQGRNKESGHTMRTITSRTMIQLSNKVFQ